MSHQYHPTSRNFRVCPFRSGHPHREGSSSRIRFSDVLGSEPAIRFKSKPSFPSPLIRFFLNIDSQTAMREGPIRLVSVSIIAFWSILSLQKAALMEPPEDAGGLEEQREQNGRVHAQVKRIRAFCARGSA